MRRNGSGNVSAQPSVAVALREDGEAHMTDTSAWFVLGGALGGVALTGLIGLVTTAPTHRRERRLDPLRGN
jgi:hypothetical protein